MCMETSPIIEVNDMGQEMDELKLEDLISLRDEIKVKLKAMDVAVEKVNKERLKVWKEIAEVDSHLRYKCEHEWTRENYFYSPLYCKVCGIER